MNSNNNTTTPAAELLMLDPSTLDLARNVRDTVDQESAAWAELVASIRSNGVLQAVSAVRYTDGSVRVIDGQRRTLAAREVGAATIPVFVRPDEHSDDKQREFDRIVTQMESNDRSQALTPDQHAAGVAEMLDLGITPTKIAAAVQLKRDDIKQAAKIGKSATARIALDTGQLDLEQAAIVAAFSLMWTN